MSHSHWLSVIILNQILINASIDYHIPISSSPKA